MSAPHPRIMHKVVRITCKLSGLCVNLFKNTCKVVWNQKSCFVLNPSNFHLDHHSLHLLLSPYLANAKHSMLASCLSQYFQWWSIHHLPNQRPLLSCVYHNLKHANGVWSPQELNVLYWATMQHATICPHNISRKDHANKLKN